MIVKNERKFALLFMAPFLLLMLIFIVAIFLNGFIIGLTDTQGINQGKFIGFGNYRYILQEERFWLSVLATFKIMAACLITQIPVSFILSIWINSIPYKKIQGLLKAFFFIPCLINSVVVGLLFRTLFSGPDCLFNLVLRFFHLPSNFNWLFDKDLSFPLVIGILFWQSIGFQIVYFAANLQTINPSIYETAKIDGASGLKIITGITLPLMRPSIIFMSVTSAITNMLLFDLLFALFPYGVSDNVRTIILYIYSVAFYGDLEIGISSAAGWIAFFIILSVSLIQIRFWKLGRLKGSDFIMESK